MKRTILTLSDSPKAALACPLRFHASPADGFASMAQRKKTRESNSNKYIQQLNKGKVPSKNPLWLHQVHVGRHMLFLFQSKPRDNQDPPSISVYNLLIRKQRQKITSGSKITLCYHPHPILSNPEKTQQKNKKK